MQLRNLRVAWVFPSPAPEGVLRYKEDKQISGSGIQEKLQTSKFPEG
jgi:hypothetical protein